MGQYIPDLTERFPEGFGGIDMTPSYFGEAVDYSMAYKNDECKDEISTEPCKLFSVGKEYIMHGFYGGITKYKVEEIDRQNERILLSETWIDVDGTGTRPSQYHKLVKDETGNEKALEWTSKVFGDVWIYA